jgi:hypothetical protein
LQKANGAATPPDSFLSCLNSSSFKTSSLGLQYLKPQPSMSQASSLQISGPQVVKYQISRFQACTQSPYSRFAIHFFRHRKIPYLPFGSPSPIYIYIYLLQVIMSIFDLFYPCLDLEHLPTGYPYFRVGITSPVRF